VPEVLKASRRQLGVPHRGLDVAVPQIGLQRPGIDAVSAADDATAAVTEG